jgi:hypothetical protein
MLDHATPANGPRVNASLVGGLGDSVEGIRLFDWSGLLLSRAADHSLAVLAAMAPWR